MSIKVTPTSKCLDKKTLLFGFEMVDLFAIFFTLAILNFLFGKSDHKLLLVWLPPLIVGLILRYGKKGKPGNHLLHLIRFQFSPGVFSAFKEPKENPMPPTITNVTEEQL